MKILFLVAAVMLFLASLGEVRAQAYPTKPVRMVVGSNVGSGPDATIRAVAGPLSDMWKQQVIVENRPSPGGVAGAAIVAKATPDGYTLLMCSVGTHGIGPVLHKKLPYDYIKDFTPITTIGAVANGLVVEPSLPVKSVKELVAYAKANPGKLHYSSSGVGNSPHLSMELFRSMAGIKLVHVSAPPGQTSFEEIASGRASAAFSNMPNAIRMTKAGRVRVLAVTSAKRNSQLPEIPTMIESGFPGFEVTVWSGICGPARLTQPIVSKINADLRKVLAMPDTQKRYAEQGAEITSSTPQEFAAFIKAENARWAEAAKSAGVEPK